MVTEQHQSLRAAFSGRLWVEPADMASFVTDWRGKWTGHAWAVVQPDTPEDVARVMRWCHEARVPVVPQGGNTGLSGGSTPDGSGRSVVLSLTRLQKVRQVDIQNNTITVDAGLTLLALQEAAAAAGRLFPLSLAAEGSCTIGGNLASNAGGVQVLRYGNARELCLGLEVVTAEGELWNGLRGLRKDNTGYDLRDLYIGSEGTLGIITGATLKLFPQPASQIVACVALSTPAQAIELLSLAQSRLGAGLTAFELMSDACLALVEKHVPGTRFPFGDRSPWYVLVELSSEQSDAVATAHFEALLEQAFEQDLIVDAAVSSNLSQFEALWALRENISEAQGAEGKTIKHDISLPASRIAEFIESTGAAVGAQSPLVRLVVFGHLGDGNLHYNLSPAAGASGNDFAALEPAMNQLVHDAVHALGGSISAEHGLGVLRRDESARYKSSIELKLMHRIKQALDPLGLMNPGKLLA
ncbi:FAD-binding oxidoreductase [Curvibacter sp. RS43]|uniref:FAD-binding oxidoreductase n=1 Tax=Curvibacter microcysteis TaxID=3026419 RepID=UPI00235F07CA|nr:FAD-binding oxidoreductase [Curvibacter sp. RS43]MDD0812719.1 FAD-binding oxidoreductase [Curvibacter sp. RS43]